MAKKLEEAQDQARKAESKNSSLNADLKKMTGNLSSAENECSALKARLQDMEKQAVAAKDMGFKVTVRFFGDFSFVLDFRVKKFRLGLTGQ